MKGGRRGEGRKIKKSIPLLPLLCGAVLLVVLIGVSTTFLEWGSPEISVEGLPSRIGPFTEITFAARDEKSGIRELEVYFEQQGKRCDALHKSFLRGDHYPYGGPATVSESRKINLKALNLDEGEATLVVKVRDFSLLGGGNEAAFSRTVLVDTLPPMLQVVRKSSRIREGSAGVVVYKVNEEIDRHGVEINDIFQVGHPLAERGKGLYAVIVALPYNAGAITRAELVAEDLTGNEARLPLAVELLNLVPRSDEIRISDNFLSSKIPEFQEHYPELSGSPLEKYIEINNRVRSANAATIKEVCQQSEPRKLWQGAFGRLSGSERRASFADRRSYYYQGRVIDQQSHLGIDLASLERDTVRAANSGKTVFADYLGIYGNMVIIDHGLGVFSLYSHLSQINVAVGDVVDRQKVIGLTGKTGMAGGDHLHFSMLVNGIFVDPVEWWDANWVKNHIDAML